MPRRALFSVVIKPVYIARTITFFDFWLDVKFEKSFLFYKTKQKITEQINSLLGC